ncbi:maleylpyruvate isomerase family mycothiol-dependent enzyme [Aeromicrobium senzhongii]|uniref:Maleylpyruvate isomerase family mycothiol-dependent enzyme n=1 Tax=Aeromicrobium senzhongii TaxID=2663859 RepID=A0ABX6SW41_9ACTN|nr:maleylpyruvate isomerase family mycothiol-dependent enzyme [Aeromicrobium senzhongii]MTB88198.1 maleylpyruvate isomerase family mycothiol-dependent enzyme [Aeromicrobium senzhongii]QNL94812.1 maleylpyruvate isomerase family mycothiol-dependent enzyme [Aeromicrobium senzhongii]
MTAAPGWTTADLVTHLGAIRRWAAAIVLSGRRIADEPAVTATEPLDEWYAGTATALIAALQAVDPDEPVPNFARIDEVAAFWPRRQLHETCIHRVDLLQACGRPEHTWDVDPEVAADGIAEAIRVFGRRMTDRGRRPHVDAPIRLVATDLDRTWIVAPDEDDPQAAPRLVQREIDVEGEAVGTATDLYLAVWGRAPASTVAPSGAAEAWLAGPRVC